MPLNEFGQKVACEPCIRGHRSSKCRHEHDRPMLQVKKPGRPLSSTCAHKAKNLDCECPPRNVTITAAIPKNKSCVCGPTKATPTDIQRINSKGAISKNGKKSCCRKDSRQFPKSEDQTPALSSSRTSSSTSIAMDRTPSSSSHSVGTPCSHTEPSQILTQQGRDLPAQVPPASMPHSCCLPQHGISLQNYATQVDFMPHIASVSQPALLSEDQDLMSALPGSLHTSHFDHFSPLDMSTTGYEKVPTNPYGVSTTLLMDNSQPLSSLNNGFVSNGCCSHSDMSAPQFPMGEGFEMPKSNGVSNQQYRTKDMSINQVSLSQTNGMAPNFHPIHALDMPHANGNGVHQHIGDLGQNFLLDSFAPKFTNNQHDHFRFQYPEGYGDSNRPLTEEDWRAAHNNHTFCVDLSLANAENGTNSLEGSGHSESQHLCSCGDACQCWACPAHPYNEHTMARLRDAAAHSFCNEYEGSPEDTDGITSPDASNFPSIHDESGYLYVKYDFSNVIDPHAHHHQHDYQHDHHDQDQDGL